MIQVAETISFKNNTILIILIKHFALSFIFIYQIYELFNISMKLSKKLWISGKNPKPVCVPLPGGFTKFCGRIYSIQRDAKNHFKACLGLELQSPTDLEATLRVSCFRYL